MHLPLTHRLFCCVSLALTAVAAIAQGGNAPPPRPPFVAQPASPPPRQAPPDASFESNRPALVAWAAELAAREPAANAASGPQLLAAYERFAVAADDGGRRTLHCVLRAIWELRLQLSTQQLRLLRADPDDPLQVAVFVRNASAAGGELFELFQRLDPSNWAWEYVGGALATRGQRTFATETYLGMVPRLHVVVTAPPPVPPGLAKRAGAGDADDVTFPERVDYGWLRTTNGLLVLSRSDAVKGLDLLLPGQVDAVTLDYARWRWLATLAGMSEPTPFGRRWVVAVPERPPADLAERVAAARARAAADGAAIDRALRERGLLPQDLARTLPPPVVVVYDDRAPAKKVRWPLPPDLAR